MAFRNFSDKRPPGFQAMSAEDMQALTEDHYPYVHAVGILSEEAQKQIEDYDISEENMAHLINVGKCNSPALIYGDMGWLFQYWYPEGDLPPALVTSSGPKGFGRVDLAFLDASNRGLFVDFEEDHIQEYLEINEELGNNSQQIIDNAVEFVMLAKRLGWAVIHVTAGIEKMKRNVAIAAKILGVKVTGFELSKQDDAVVEKLKPFIESVKKHIEAKKPDAIDRCVVISEG